MPTPRYRLLLLAASGVLVAAGIVTAPCTATADPMSDFMCSAGSTAPEFCFATPPKPRPTPQNKEPEPKYPYQNCAQARNAGKTPLYRWDYGYSPALDPDGDGIACPYESA